MWVDVLDNRSLVLCFRRGFGVLSWSWCQRVERIKQRFDLDDRLGRDRATLDARKTRLGRVQRGVVRRRGHGAQTRVRPRASEVAVQPLDGELRPLRRLPFILEPDRDGLVVPASDRDSGTRVTLACAYGQDTMGTR